MDQLREMYDSLRQMSTSQRETDWCRGGLPSITAFRHGSRQPMSSVARPLSAEEAKRFDESLMGRFERFNDPIRRKHLGQQQLVEKPLTETEFAVGFTPFFGLGAESVLPRPVDPDFNEVEMKDYARALVHPFAKALSLDLISQSPDHVTMATSAFVTPTEVSWDTTHRFDSGLIVGMANRFGFGGEVGAVPDTLDFGFRLPSLLGKAPGVDLQFDTEWENRSMFDPPTRVGATLVAEMSSRCRLGAGVDRLADGTFETALKADLLLTPKTRLTGTMTPARQVVYLDHQASEMLGVRLVGGRNDRCPEIGFGVTIDFAGATYLVD